LDATHKAFDGVSTAQWNSILDDIDEGLEDGRRYSAAPNAGDEVAAWTVITRHLDRTEEQARKIIKTWIDNGVLFYEEYTAPRGRKRQGLRVDPGKRPGNEQVF